MNISMKALVELIKWNCPFLIDVRIEGTWEDFGANLWWETIIISYRSGEQKGTYQALSPRQHQILTTRGMTVAEAEEFIKEIKRRGW